MQDDNKKKETSAIKIQRAFRSHRHYRHSLENSKKNPVRTIDVPEGEALKKKHPDLFYYLNWYNLGNNALYISTDLFKINLLAEILNTHGDNAKIWEHPIFRQENFNQIALAAYEAGKITEEQRSSAISYHNLIVDYGYEKLSTVKLIENDQLSKEAKNMLRDFFNGHLLKLDATVIEGIFSSIKPSENYLTIIDITAYKAKKKTLYHVLPIDGCFIVDNANTYAHFIHYGALKAIYQHFLGFSFKFMIGLISREQIREAQIKGFRLADERLDSKEIGYLKDLHTVEGVSAHETGYIHDIMVHAAMSGSFPEDFRIFLLNNIYQIAVALKNFWNDEYHQLFEFLLDQTVDLNSARFFLQKFEYSLEKFNFGSIKEYTCNDFFRSIILNSANENYQPHVIFLLFIFLTADKTLNKKKME